jgi:hypothetical protein
MGKKVKYGLDFKSVSDVRFTYTYQGSMMKDLKLKCGKNVERFKPLCHLCGGGEEMSVNGL